MFQLKLNAFTVNSQIAGCNCKVSALQQMDMGLPEVSGDNSLNLLFMIDMSKEEIEQEGLTAEFRNSSTIRESIPMRSSEDVERIAVELSKMVADWSSPIGGNWIGSIPYSPENVATLLKAMGKNVPSAAHS